MIDETEAALRFLIHHSSLGLRRLLVDAFDSYVRAEACDDETFAHVETARERSLVLCLGLPLFVIPELAVGAVAVPAEVAVGDRLNREELEATQKTVALRHLDAVAQDLNRDEFFVRV
jgi:hypothetical protein